VQRSAVRMLNRVGGVLLAGVVAAVVWPATNAFAVPHPPPPPGTVTTQGLYHMTTSYNGDQFAVKGWQVSWTVPQFTNGDAAWGAVGQWFSAVEGGIYYTPSEGWWVYYYGDDNGFDGNNPDCTPSWGTGGHCHGAMENLVPGQKVTFVYQFCNATSHAFDAGSDDVCLWVNMNDGVGDRFLMTDAQRKDGAGNPFPEMYAHDIETFGDSGFTEPIVSCVQPTKMLGQRARINGGDWVNLNGSKWNFSNDNPNYGFRNVNLPANPSTWESCSPSTAVCTAPAWSSTTVYATAGHRVSFNGRNYVNKWWTQNEKPGQAAVWRDLGPC
jgi:hypothetical protein